MHLLVTTNKITVMFIFFLLFIAKNITFLKSQTVIGLYAMSLEMDWLFGKSMKNSQTACIIAKTQILRLMT